RSREGHCRVPQRALLADFPLGAWVIKQRGRKNKASDERRQRLDDLGFGWRPHTTAWGNAFSLLNGYKVREGPRDVPNSYKTHGLYLGAWGENQRHWKNSLTLQQQQRLEQIGFLWGALKDRWEQGCKILALYRNREGHCRVPAKHKEGDFPLG